MSKGNRTKKEGSVTELPGSDPTTPIPIPIPTPMFSWR